uniref:Uncharacterized protein orf150 n=1 Tax=Floydiella terrestris TaxID=51328 RepID=E2DSP2_FLOTE|nr:hypothetical protein FlteC_p072 [Floydiella terrestris]ACZ58500.1 hypothetical protein [Floydiella terrestris]
MALHKEIHKAFHKEFGIQQSTKEQFERFVEKHSKNADCAWNKGLAKEKSLGLESIGKNLEEQMLAARTIKEFEFEKILEIAKKHGHEFLSGKYENQNSLIPLYCPHHKKTQMLKSVQYKYNKHGLFCCGRAASTNSVNKRKRDSEGKRSL